MAHPSGFRGFLAFLSTVRGDLTNITSPPYLLAPLSVTELAATCWTERPSLYIAPTLESSPQKRALLVLKWILSSLRTQFYVTRDQKAGIKKPLNAFLGELFFGQFTDSTATVNALSEQVSHHPPVSACYMWDNEHGIRGEGYTRVEMTFNGNISIKQTGHAMVHIDKYDEDYLIPIPGAKVKGLFSGRPYPELGGTYHIISSTGLVSEITFSGTGFFSGSRNSFEAKIYQRDDKAKSPLYTARGQWNGKFTIHDGANDNDIETCDLGTYQPAPLTIPDEAEQDSWETRRAWKDVIQALKRGDMRGTVMEKSKLEEAQRALRRKEAANGTPWQPLFFSPLQGNYPLFDGLASAVGWPLEKERTKGVWKVNREKAEHAEKLKPYHGIVTPMG